MATTRKKPPLSYRWLHATLGRLIRWYFPVRVEGEIPKGQFIAYSAHTAVIDSYVILAILERHRLVKIPAKAEYFEDGDLKQRFIRWLVRQAGVPVDRDDRDSGQSALTVLRGVIDDGGSPVLHPEGTRTDGRAVYKGKTGLIQLALDTGVPLLPIVLHGTAIANEPGRRWLRRRRIIVKLLPAVTVEPSRALRAVEQIEESKRTDLIRRQIERLRKYALERSARDAMELLAAHQGVPYVNEDYRKRQRRTDRF